MNSERFDPSLLESSKSPTNSTHKNDTSLHVKSLERAKRISFDSSHKNANQKSSMDRLLEIELKS